MKHNLARHMRIPCGNEECHYWDDTEVQNCSKDPASGEAAPIRCPSYTPDEEA